MNKYKKYLKLCTLTGASDSTDPQDLIELSKQYPFVEWGILYSETRAGTGRYPSKEWINSFLDAISMSEHKPNIAIHVCGTPALMDLVNNRGYVSIIVQAFNRIQMNLSALMFNINAISSPIIRHPNKTFITQYKPHNLDLYRKLSHLPNHSILFDSSGGNGISPAYWPKTLEGVSCGYAGGLSSTNVQTNLVSIIKHGSPGKDFWIDMESSLLDNEILSIEKCRTVLEKVQEMMNL